MASSLLSVLGLWHAVGEGDGERVQGWFPPYGPPCLTGTFRVQGPGDQVQALHRGLLGRKVSAGLDRPEVPGVQALDRAVRWPRVIVCRSLEHVSVAQRRCGRWIVEESSSLLWGLVSLRPARPNDGAVAESPSASSKGSSRGSRAVSLSGNTSWRPARSACPRRRFGWGPANQGRAIGAPASTGSSAPLSSEDQRGAGLVRCHHNSQCGVLTAAQLSSRGRRCEITPLSLASGSMATWTSKTEWRGCRCPGNPV